MRGKSCVVRGVVECIVVHNRGIRAEGPEKMRQCWWTWNPQEKPKLSRQDCSKNESWK